MVDSAGIHVPPVRFVLVEPTHPGNIGGVGRAMKTMGFDSLCLVNPRRFPADEATAMAVGAADVLERASIADSFPAAVADCRLVIGTSARLRRIRWPSLSPEAAAARLIEFSKQGPVAVVFGRESSGLSNEELDLCHYLAHIPCSPDFMSLNLSSAVQVIAYELRKQLLVSVSEGEEVPSLSGADALAALEEVEGFYAHLDGALQQAGFFVNREPELLMRRLRRLFNRAHLSHREINILRGMLSAFASTRHSTDEA